MDVREFEEMKALVMEREKGHLLAAEMFDEGYWVTGCGRGLFEEDEEGE